MQSSETARVGEEWGSSRRMVLGAGCWGCASQCVEAAVCADLAPLLAEHGCLAQDSYGILLCCTASCET